MAQYYSPYEGMGNNPVVRYDVHGDCSPCETVQDPNSPNKPGNVNLGELKEVVISDRAPTSWQMHNNPNIDWSKQPRYLQIIENNYRDAYRNNPYMFSSKAVDKAWGNIGIGLTMFIGGEVLGGAKLFSWGYKAAGFKAAMSFTSQAASSGIKKVDYADVAFDAFTSPYMSAVLDAEIDIQPFNTGPKLAIGGIKDKSFYQVGFETGANFIVGKAADHSFSMMGSFATNVGGKVATNSVNSRLFGQ
jgi:hypothetical protein